MRGTPDSPRRTVAVTARNRSRFARPRLHYPDTALGTGYDADLARELLASTGELPTSKSELIALLAEYRRAVYSLTQLLVQQ